MYNQQFKHVLFENDVYSGEIEHAPLRFLYKEIIDSIKLISVLEKNTQYTVQLTEVDEKFVKSVVTNILENSKEKTENFSKEDIINVVCSHTNDINQSILNDIQRIVEAYALMRQEPNFVHVQYSINELREKKLWID